ncbi:Uncharacterised protein [Mycobacteroides abscessus subsp. abscessus]|nr:Uncharacterised protein [Mycobacteroides abscessus subsp. abscessus]
MVSVEIFRRARTLALGFKMTPNDCVRRLMSVRSSREPIR